MKKIEHKVFFGLMFLILIVGLLQMENSSSLPLKITIHATETVTHNGESATLYEVFCGYTFGSKYGVLSINDDINLVRWTVGDEIILGGDTFKVSDVQCGYTFNSRFIRLTEIT